MQDEHDPDYYDEIDRETPPLWFAVGGVIFGLIVFAYLIG